jgi:hypothetical protein
MRSFNTFFKIFFVAMALSLSGSAIVAGPSEGQEQIFNGKEKDLFVYRTAKGLIGAKVEVFSDSGELVTAQTMQKRKIIIDFGDVAFGTYTIKVTKGNMMQEFQFVKH